ncbi:MAG: asparagine synthase (glutamine-hydrolyzing) [Bacteroidota bacterium]
MCGIAGFTSKTPVDRPTEKLQGMIDVMSHRGPNAEGIFEDEIVHLGHRRLSILDLTEVGNQPIQDHSGRYTMVFNGEIYNYQEIKAELKDYPFKGTGDTEMILAAYRAWGPDCLQKFNGMFALAIWDEAEQSLFIARDRLGIKPLYYVRTGEDMVFASEIRSIIRSGLIQPEIDPLSLQEYLQYYSVNSPRTILKHVFQLKAGHFGIWKGGHFHQEAFWAIEDTGENTQDLDEVKKEVRTRLMAAVERRMISDVPLGAFLSGGIDSSAIVALMAEASSQPVHTFSVVFQEKAFDESTFSRMIAEKYRTAHHPILLKPEDFLHELEPALEAMDHPTGDGINSYVVSQATKREGFTVALSGLGGDELFAGYPVFQQYKKFKQAQSLYQVPLGLRKLGSQAAGTLVAKHKVARLQELMTVPNAQFEHLYPVFRKLFSPAEIEQLTGTYVKDSTLGRIFEPETLRKIDQLPIYSQVSVGEISTYTQNVLLRDTDQMSMAHSLEVRVPFFDHELVEYVMGIPDALKHPHFPKQLLVESLGELLPHEVVHRKKMGFVFPWPVWMKNELREMCTQSITRLSERNLIQEEMVQRLWKDFLNGDPQAVWMKLWMLVILDQWMLKNEC